MCVCHQTNYLFVCVLPDRHSLCVCYQTDSHSLCVCVCVTRQTLCVCVTRQTHSLCMCVTRQTLCVCVLPDRLAGCGPVDSSPDRQHGDSPPPRRCSHQDEECQHDRDRLLPDQAVVLLSLPQGGSSHDTTSPSPGCSSRDTSLLTPRWVKPWYSIMTPSWSRCPLDDPFHPKPGNPMIRHWWLLVWLLPLAASQPQFKEVWPSRGSCQFLRF